MKNQKGSYGKVSEKKQYRFSFVSIDAENRKLIALKNLARSNEKITIKIIQNKSITANRIKSRSIQTNHVESNSILHRSFFL